MRIVAALLLLTSAAQAPVQAQNLGQWCLPPLPCVQVTCDMVRRGAVTMSQAQLDYYLSRATAAQTAAGRVCLGLPTQSKARKKRK